MATHPIGGSPAIVTLPGTVPPMPAVARILSRYDRGKLAAFIEVAIELLDVIDGPADPDQPDFAPRSDGLPGDPADHEPAGDEQDAAWNEWHVSHHAAKRGPRIAGHEDDAPANVRGSHS